MQGSARSAATTLPHACPAFDGTFRKNILSARLPEGGTTEAALSKPHKKIRVNPRNPMTIGYQVKSKRDIQFR